MKKFILSLVLVVSAGINSFGQGTIVFQDYSNSLVTINNGSGSPLPAPITATSGIKLELFYQLDNGGAAPTPFSGGSIGDWVAIPTLLNIFPILGRFSGLVMTGNNVNSAANPTGNVWLEAVAFNGNASSFSAAINGASTLIGYSTVWGQGTGNNNGEPPTAAVTTFNFTGIELSPYSAPAPVPDSSMLIIDFAGMAALFCCARKGIGAACPAQA